MSKEKLDLSVWEPWAFAMCYGCLKGLYHGAADLSPGNRPELQLHSGSDEKAKTALYDEMLNNGCNGSGVAGGIVCGR